MMKKIQILGPGCANCTKLYEVAEEAAKELGWDYKMEKVTDIMEIAMMGVMKTPGLVLDGKIVCTGMIPSKDQTKELLSKA